MTRLCLQNPNATTKIHVVVNSYIHAVSLRKRLLKETLLIQNIYRLYFCIMNGNKNLPF